MTWPPFILSALMGDEGFRSRLYRDSVGKWTGGYGHNFDDNPLTLDDAKYFLVNDIDRASTQLDAKLPWWRTLDDVRQGVLLNMCFNMGILRLMGFQRTLMAIQNGNFETAAQEMLDSRWAQQVGQRAIRLAQEMKTGVTA